MRTFSNALTALLLFALFLPGAAAQQGIQEDENSVRMMFGSDVYTAGEDIVIEGTVEDDVLAAGASVRIMTTVPGDVLAAGGKIDLRGMIEDDARIAGGDISLSGGIANDAVIMGGTVRLLETSVISGSVMIFGGDITIDGVIKGDLLIRGGNVTINGRIGGNTDMRGGSVRLNGQMFGDAILGAAEVTLGSTATIEGDLRYWQQDGQEEFAGVQGTATFDPDLSMQQPEENEGLAAAILGVFAFYTIFSAALMIGVLLFCTKTLFSESAKRLQQAPWMGLLIAFLFFLLLPVIGILFLVTIIGLPLAAAIFAVWLLSLLFAKTVASTVFAHWVQMRAKKKWHPALVFLLALGIFIVLKLVGLIPYIGWITCMILTMIGFGAYLQVKYDRYKKVR